MSGPSDNFEQRGLCARTIEYIFSSIGVIADDIISVKFSGVEIYNDIASDLLRMHNLKEIPKLTIIDSPNGVLVPELLLAPVSNAEEGIQKLFESNANRSK